MFTHVESHLLLWKATVKAAKDCFRPCEGASTGSNALAAFLFPLLPDSTRSKRPTGAAWKKTLPYRQDQPMRARLTVVLVQE